ncbi:AcrB/AcrD/AcrF family protein [Sphingomonas histidinilytica]|jgi:multidrug efflux pump subunit AcrB|uniref:Multidrug efflux pump subunit AcrB n=1 Tax=Rhizorhabdus histidinilytica TaxID=439228 RepID=A0A1T4ZSY7_9SPHN|nr:efflux RND transporter permease subunit [Rhizorhabdus histidinilytica]MBO9379808.1 AcrB/AcrD/AcrF family protein [Rhizorhabdus histidinilytica]QEH78726.1 efflux RND transporter permease subunit [Sphingomonas sp. C8-2]SKB25443.1 Multidrug efflux pump subunit AcrB [Rhizorhabdus histidinilytica]
MRNISAWAIRNPIPPIVLFAALTLAGLISFARMDINQMPDISFPAAEVQITQPGAAPTEMETQITRRVEAAVASIGNVKSITSYVTEGTSGTNVEFHLGTPVDRAVNDVRDAVAKIRAELPEGILEPTVQRLDVEGGPIAYYSIEGVDMTLEQLSWFTDNTVIKRLQAIDGMAGVFRGGGVSREIRVILDPARMQAQGVTASQVNNILRSVNLNAAGGRAELAGAEQSVRVLGNAASAYELGQTQISVGDGRTVRLADIATVRDAYGEQRQISKMNGRQVLSIGIQKAKGASDVKVYDAAQKVLDELRKENPKITFKELYTSVIYTKEQYKSAIHAMVEGSVLAVIVVFFFLRDWRATMISALAIPLSAIPAFWFMDLMGFTLNTISLLALSLVAGILVDDAIVEIENIVRHMRMGKTAYQASMDAADEIGLAVVATTMSIVAVFLPVSFMPGIPGQFFEQFGLTVAVAVLMSLAVARLITPMIAAYFLKAEGVKEHGGGPVMDKYIALLKWSLVNRWKTIGIGVVAFLVTIALFATSPQQFQPALDVDYSQVKIELTPGARVAQDTQKVADETIAVLRQQPEVDAAFADIGDNGDTRFASIYITLKPAKERTRTSIEFERETAPLLNKIPDARVNFVSQSGGFGRDLTIMLAGDDPVKLQQSANALIAQMRKSSIIRDPRIDGDIQRPELIIKPRLDLAADLGVTTAALSNAIRIATLGDIEQNMAKFSLSDRQIPIRVSLSEASRRDLSSIENMPVQTTSGGTVPLKVVADINFGAGPSKIRRYNQVRRLVVGADLVPGAVSGDAYKYIYATPIMKNLPAGVREVKFGEQEFQGDLISGFAIAVVSGILLVFAVLVLLYKRVLPPFVNMASLLLAPLGGVLALRIVGMPISMPVYIGLLMLFGIVAKNSILLVDFAIEEMRHGANRFDAILEAAHKRAQPIVMTSVAMIAGMVPIAIGLSGDSSWRAPMAVCVIGGIAMSTLLTLVIVPAGFTLADDMEKWIGPRLGKLLVNNEEHKSGPAAQPAE